MASYQKEILPLKTSCERNGPIGKSSDLTDAGLTATCKSARKVSKIPTALYTRKILIPEKLTADLTGTGDRSEYTVESN